MAMSHVGLLSGRFDDVVVVVQEVFIFSVPLLIRLFEFRAGGTEMKPPYETFGQQFAMTNCRFVFFFLLF